MNDKVTATLVANEDRREFLPSTFGTRHMMYIEAEVYNWMGRLCKGYSGGFWNFYKLSNGAGYMSLSTDQAELEICVDTNGYRGTMSPEAASLVACVFAVNMTLWKFKTEELDTLYFKLMDFVYQHPEWKRIGAALD